MMQIRHRIHALAALVFIVIVCVHMSPALSVEIEELILQLRSDDAKSRIVAIRKLAETNDQRAVDALIEMLDVPIKDREEQEETWFHLAQSIYRLTKTGDVSTGRAVAALEKIEKVEAQFRTLQQRCGRITVAKYPFAETAKQVVDRIYIQRTMKKIELAIATMMTPEEKVSYLAERAWKRPEKVRDFYPFVAREKLKSFGPLAVKPTIGAVQQMDSVAQSWAVRFLADTYRETGTPDAITGLLELSKPRPSRKWTYAIWELSRIKHAGTAKALARIVDDTQKPPEDFVSYTISAIGAIAPGDVLPFLAEKLAHENSKVRLRAAESLAAAGESAVPLLIRHLAHQEQNVRWAAIHGLTGVDSGNAKSAIARYLAAHMNEDLGWVHEAINRKKDGTWN